MRRLIWRLASLAMVGWLFGAHALTTLVGGSPLGQVARANPAATRAGCEAVRKELVASRAPASRPAHAGQGATARSTSIFDRERLYDMMAAVTDFIRRHGWPAAASTRPCDRVVR